MYVYLYVCILQVCIFVFVLHSLFVCNELSSETSNVARLQNMFKGTARFTSPCL